MVDCHTSRVAVIVASSSTFNPVQNARVSEDALDRVSRICLALPEAFEKQAWGHPTFRVGKGMFAIYSSSMDLDGPARPGLRCKAPLGVQEHLVRAEPNKYYIPAYLGAKGWIGLLLESCTDAEIQGLVTQSYCMVAPKRLQSLVSG